MSQDPPNGDSCQIDEAEPGELQKPESSSLQPPRPRETPPEEDADHVRRRQEQFIAERTARLGPRKRAEDDASEHLARMREYRQRQRRKLEKPSGAGGARDDRDAADPTKSSEKEEEP